MKPTELQSFLSRLIESGNTRSVMIWGKPGIGKSSLVAAVAKKHKLALTDVRLSQLMPSDLRGVPVPDDKATHWRPPSFLPTKGKGILFLDELNMAPPALQGVAQQLILDRQIGDYTLPKGWLVWSAGNRMSDRAAVYSMSAPLANRFLHLESEVDLDDFRQFAYSNSIAEDVIGFLAFRPELLHKMTSDQEAWPSPRSWHMASELHSADLPIDSAVGISAALEFSAFVQIKAELPDVTAILKGTSKAKMPTDPSACYAITSSLVARSDSADAAFNAFIWMVRQAKPEWVQMMAADLFPQLQERGLYKDFAPKVMQDEAARAFLSDFAKLLQ